MVKVHRIRKKRRTQHEKPHLNLPIEIRFITVIPIFQGHSKLEFPAFLGDSVVPERNLRD
jgi:hypothetical protein